MAPNINNNNNATPLTPIQEFFSGASIFVTGATGFMGKCLIEKLLRSCSDIEKIYILVREKKGKAINTRVEDMFKDMVFSKVLATSDKLRNKIIPIAGDVSSPGLGMNLEDRSMLERDVHVVFHAAATVNFNEKLSTSVAINFNGTKEVMDLCRSMDKLKSVIHVSTAYTNCHLPRIREKFYHYPISYKNLPSMIEKIETHSEDLTLQLIYPWPNTYTFTKAMSESLIEDTKGDLPVGVFRPGIVISTWREPLEGWLDNVYGPTGITAGGMAGVVGSLWINKDLKANLVPADFVINALIATAWEVGVKKRREVTEWQADEDNYTLGSMYKTPPVQKIKEESDSDEPTVYHYVSNPENPITWGQFCAISVLANDLTPLKNSVWSVNFQLTKSYPVHYFRMIIFHLIPALIGDGVSLAIGKKPRLIKVFKQINKVMDVLSYFTQREYDFSNCNTQSLWQSMDPRDKEIYPFNMKELNWLNYIQKYVHGVRRYIFKEDDKSIPGALVKCSRLQVVSKILNALVTYVFVAIIFYLFKLFYSLLL